MAAVEQPEFALLERTDVVDERSRRPPPTPAVRRGTSPASTHSVNGSVTTGASSVRPVSAATLSRSASVVAGVIRSTIVVTNETLASIQPA